MTSPVPIHEPKSDSAYLLPTAILDSDHDRIQAFAREKTGAAGEDRVKQAVALYYAVRDGIWYTPYYPFYAPAHYRASSVLESGRGYCVSKASLLCALGRAVGIPSRVGFADVRNHLATQQLIDYLGSNLFVYHGYVEFLLEGKWTTCTPAFNRELCRRHKVPALEFDGRNDSLFQAYNEKQQKFMDYVAYHGTFDDIPVDRIVAAWKKEFGEDRVAAWIKAFEQSDGKLKRNFYQEDVIDA